MCEYEEHNFLPVCVAMTDFNHRQIVAICSRCGEILKC